MPKVRLDVLLVERGLAESRAKAQALVMAGQVRVNGEVALKPADAVLPEARVEVDHGPRFVSRGGEKLDGALTAFPIDVQDRICADVGASTGGFTDCLLQHGAARVYSIDVGKGLLHWRLRNDSRVVVMEETNARYLATLPEQVSLISVDASFISLRILLPVVRKWFVADAPRDLIMLIKPQFEAGRADVSRGDGVIRDPDIHRNVLLQALAFARQKDLGVHGLIKSPLLGPKGNTEFLAWLVPDAQSVNIPEIVERALTMPTQSSE